MDDNERRRLAAEYERTALAQHSDSPADRYGRWVLLRFVAVALLAAAVYAAPRLLDFIR
jgi:hypothetical protein